MIKNTKYYSKLLESFLKILLITVMSVYTYSNTYSQCACAGTDYASIDVAGWTVGQSGTITTNQWGGERSTIYNTVNGAVYRVSSCGASYDTQLSIYTTACVFVTGGYNDDNGPACGGSAASVQFTSPGGNLYSKLNLYNCTTNSTGCTITITLVSIPCTPGSISGAPATICTGSNITYTWAGTGTFTCFQYQWDGTGGAWTDWGATNPYTWGSSWAGHTLYVRAKIAGGACYSPAVSTLVQDNVASAGSISPSSLVICAGSSITLNSTVNSSALGNPTLYIKWYRHDGIGWTFLTQNNSQTYTEIPPAGVYTYLRRTWTSCGAECSPACYDATCIVTVANASTAATSISASINPVCTGNPTILTLNGGSLGMGGTWTWGYGVCSAVFYQDWNTQPYGTWNTTVNSVAGGLLNVTSTSNDPMIGMEAVGSFDPSIYKYVQIRYRVVSGTAGDAQIFYTNDRSTFAVGDQMVSGALISDGAWHSLSINMSVAPYWNGYGNIRGWRYDWCTASGVTMELDNISLSIGQGTSITVNPTANTTYYVRAEGVCNNTNCVNLPVTVISTLPATPNAGEDQYICGATSITMTATGTGTWTQISGPNTPNIVNTTIATTQIGTGTPLISGTYVFRWSASNACGTSYDDVVIIKQ